MIVPGICKKLLSAEITENEKGRRKGASTFYSALEKLLKLVLPF